MKASRRTLRRMGQIFGLWYAVIIAGSVVLPLIALEPRTLSVWPSALLHGGADHDCVMCGLTRSFLAMSRGEVGAAFQFNGAGPLLYVAMLLLAVWAIGSIGRERGLLRSPTMRSRHLRRA